MYGSVGLCLILQIIRIVGTLVLYLRCNGMQKSDKNEHSAPSANQQELSAKAFKVKQDGCQLK